MIFTTSATAKPDQFIKSLNGALPQIGRNEQGYFAISPAGGLEYLGKNHFPIEELLEILATHGMKKSIIELD